MAKFLIILLFWFSKCHALIILDGQDFQKQNPSVEREELVNYITNQFKTVLRYQVTQEQINQLWANQSTRKKLKLMRFQIIKQHLYADSYDITHLYFVTLYSYLIKLTKKYQIADLDFIVLASDELLDANFVYLPSGQQISSLLTKLNVKIAKPVQERDHLSFKYLISLDGYTCAWLRVPWIMLSNSVLLKQQTSKIEWFYSAIKPYVHYLPVQEDLSDLNKIFSWAQEHDDFVHEISNNATNFVMNNLMTDHIEAHMVIILNKYAKLHRGIPLPRADQVYNFYNIVKIFWSRI